MRRYLTFATIPLFLVAGLFVACNGGGDGDTDADGIGTVGPGHTPAAGATEPLPASTDGPEDTPTEFETIRDELSDQLDAIGVNIGVVPDDIRDQILGACRELEGLGEGERVAEVCEAIERAIETDDPGLIDLILDELAELQPD